MRQDRLPSPGQPAYKTYRWAVVIMLWLICVFNYADRQAIASVDKALGAEFHFTDGDLGMIKSAFMIVYALTAPFAGQVGDAFARKWVIIVGLYVWSAVTGFTAICSKLWHFVFVRGAEGLGETFYFPASMSLVSDYHATSTRSRAMGLHQTGVYVGTIFGGAFAGWMGQHYGWRWPFVILGGGGIILGIILATFIREPAREEAQRYETPETVSAGPPPKVPMAKFLMEWARTPSAILLLLAFLCANFVAMQFLMWTQTFLVRKFNITPAQAGVYGTAFIQVGSMVGATGGGALADYLRRSLPGGRMLVQCLGVLVGAPLIYAFGAASNITTICVVMALYGIFKGVYDAGIWASLYDVVPAARRGAACGLMNMVGWLAGAGGVWLMGAHTDRYVAALSHGSKAESVVMPLKVQAMSAGFEYLTVIYIVAAALLIAAGLRFAKRDVERVAAMAE
jgi:MFS family permease